MYTFGSGLAWVKVWGQRVRADVISFLFWEYILLTFLQVPLPSFGLNQVKLDNGTANKDNQECSIYTADEALLVGEAILK